VLSERLAAWRERQLIRFTRLKPDRQKTAPFSVKRKRHLTATGWV